MIKAYYIPSGPKNLKAMFPTLNFDNIDEYYVEVKAAGLTIATTPDFKMEKTCEDDVRIRFLNYSGTIDGINFNLVTDEHEAKSSTMQRPLSIPLTKSSHSIHRYAVKANNILTLSNSSYGEDEMSWINELVDSPLAWIEWKGIQGQPDDYIPIVMMDAKIFNRKAEERYYNEVILQVYMSNEKIIIRN